MCLESSDEVTQSQPQEEKTSPLLGWRWEKDEGLYGEKGKKLKTLKQGGCLDPVSYPQSESLCKGDHVDLLSACISIVSANFLKNYQLQLQSDRHTSNFVC